jgi:uncharacterized membrane protein (DUF485 family)
MGYQYKEIQMDQSTVDKIQQSESFQTLVKHRTSLAIKLTIAMLVIYYGFIALIAFNPAIFKMIVIGSNITIGVPMGVGIILSAFVLTGIYVRKANSDFDELSEKIKAEHHLS